MPQRIMVINDTQEILELFREILETEGYSVSLHSYSTRDMDDVRRIKPDLIVSDHPPFREEQGWQFVQKVKMSPDLAHIPIVICSTSLKWIRTNVDEGWLSAKRISIVPKPFEVPELLQEVAALLATSPAIDQHSNADQSDS